MFFNNKVSLWQIDKLIIIFLLFGLTHFHKVSAPYDVTKSSDVFTCTSSEFLTAPTETTPALVLFPSNCGIIRC